MSECIRCIAWEVECKCPPIKLKGRSKTIIRNEELETENKVLKQRINYLIYCIPDLTFGWENDAIDYEDK